MKKLKEKDILKIIVGIGIFIYMIFGTSFLSDMSSAINEGKKSLDSQKVISDGGDLSVYFLDVGQGDAIFIKNEDKTMLIDAGEEVNGKKIVNFLNNNEITKLDYLIATHPHDDHIGGMAYVINNMEIDKIYMSYAISTSKTFENLLDALENKNYSYSTFNAGDTFDFGTSAFEVIESLEEANDLNDSSIILKLVNGNNSFLFMGDASTTVENKILNEDLKSDVLKVGHHGSGTSTSSKFLDKVSPSYAIISVGKDNKYNHPNDATLKRLTDKNIKVFRTDLNGSILVTSDGDNINVSMVNTDTN